MPRRVFDELGGFDEDFFVSHEDVDLSYRARLRGYHCRYVPGAVVRHHGSQSIGRASELAVFHGQRNLEWVYLKNSPWNVLVRTLPGHAVYTLAAAVHFASTGRLGAFLRAKAAALRGLPEVLRKRRVVQQTRRVGDAAIWPHLARGWLGIKRAEKRFDAGLAGKAP
jgi:GT2 family glycosyltransferase